MIRRSRGDRPLQVVVVGQTPPPLHGQAVVNSLLEEAEFPEIDVVVVPMHFSKSLEDLDRFAWRKLAELVRVIGAVYVLVSRGKRDVLVYSVGLRSSRPVGRDVAILLLCRFFFRQTVLHLHTEEPMKFINRLCAPLRMLAYRAYGGADAVLLVAEGLAGSDIPFPEARDVIVVANGIEPPGTIVRSHHAGPVMRVLFVGNMYESKGTHVLLRACAAVHDWGVKDIRVDLVGPAPSDDVLTELQRLASELGVGHVVRFLGPRYGEEKWAAYGDADVFCYPTLGDAAPLVVLEALAAGLPIITTRTRGMASLVDDGVTGVLVDAGDHDGVADALFELLTCESRRRQMAVAAQARFLENFTADAFRQRFEEAMVRVVKARPLAPALSRRHVLHAGSPGVLRRHGCKREGRQSPVRTAEGPRLGAS